MSMAAIYAVSVSIAAVSPAAAQGLPLIRDTEIENLLKDYSLPIFRAAGLGSQNIAMRVIRHESFNAFVVDGRNVFINTGHPDASQDAQRGDRRDRPRGGPHHGRPHGAAPEPHRPRRDQEPAADHPGHRPDGRRRICRRRRGARGRQRRGRPGHGRQRHGDSLDAHRAPFPGIGSGPGRPARCWKPPGSPAAACRRRSSASPSRNSGRQRTSTRSCAAIP